MATTPHLALAALGLFPQNHKVTQGWSKPRGKRDNDDNICGQQIYANIKPHCPPQNEKSLTANQVSLIVTCPRHLQ